MSQACHAEREYPQGGAWGKKAEGLYRCQFSASSFWGFSGGWNSDREANWGIPDLHPLVVLMIPYCEPDLLQFIQIVISGMLVWMSWLLMTAWYRQQFLTKCIFGPEKKSFDYLNQCENTISSLFFIFLHRRDSNVVLAYKQKTSHLQILIPSTNRQCIPSMEGAPIRSSRCPTQLAAV